MENELKMPFQPLCTVVRIQTDNPGYWLMHCHQMMHAIEGMDVVIKVAPEKASPMPKNFPDKCGGYFEFSHEDYQNLVRGSHEKAMLPRFFDGFFD